MTPDTHDALDSLLAARRSCRAFLKKQVPEAIIRRILRTAQRTASWCNAQPWRVIVTRGAATDQFRHAYTEAVASTPPGPDFAFPTEYQSPYLERRRECGGQLYASLGIARGDREAAGMQTLRNYELFGAPHVAIITCEAQLGVYAAVDCGAYVANFLNAATAAGIGCIAQAALASHPDAVRQHFELPASQRVVCGISFGYADVGHPGNSFRTSRAGLEEVITWKN